MDADENWWMADADAAADDDVGPRVINLLWLLSARLGWRVDDGRRPGAMFVNRGILIAAQWLANTLAALPLALSLTARFALLVPSVPLDYHLDGLPYTVRKRMR